MFLFLSCERVYLQFHEFCVREQNYYSYRYQPALVLQRRFIFGCFVTLQADGCTTFANNGIFFI